MQVRLTVSSTRRTLFITRFRHLLPLLIVPLSCGEAEPELTGHSQSGLTADIVVDDADPGATVTSGWFMNATAATEHFGTMSRYATTGGQVDTYRFTPDLPGAATYSVYAWNSCYPDRATDVPHVIHDGTGQTYTVDVDQDCNTGSHGEWFHLGDFPLGLGAYVEITDAGITSSSPYFGADAVRFLADDEGASGAGATGSTSSTASSSVGAGTGGAGGVGGMSTSGGGGVGGSGASNPFGFEPFDGSSLDASWSVLNPQMVQISVQTGQVRLAVDPTCASYPFCAWFNDTQGPLIYKLVTGDFRVTTLARPRRLSDPELAVQGGFQLVGILVRDPSASDENYIFNGTGYRGSFLAHETKTTVDGSSSVSGPAYPDQSTADRELTTCRVGQQFHVYEREIGAESWNLVTTYDRTSSPLSGTLQVGIVAYNYDTPANVVGQFDHTRIAPVATATDCLP